MPPTDPAIPPTGGTITAITPQKKATDRYSIFLDGAFAFGLGVDVLLEFGLAQGMALSDEQVREILAREEIVTATNAALNLLAYRARASGEMETRLRQKGFSLEAIAATMEKLRSWRYLDDADFASQWVGNRQAHRPRSRRVLAQELRAKGIDRDTIEETLESTEIDEAADALAIAQAKWPSLQNLEPEVRRRRLAAFLGRRGYGYDIVREVLKALDADPDDG